MQHIILIGAGGHCRSVIEVIESSKEFTIAGILDKKELVGSRVLGYEVIGTDDDLPSLITSSANFHITVGHIKSNTVRVKLFEQIKKMGGNFPVIQASTATVSKHAAIEEGTIIMHHAIVNSNARIGKNCIVNTAAIIEHDVQVGDHCHISTGAIINGESQTGSHTFIGSHATILQTISIADHNLIAAGAVVTRSTESFGMYAGNPATLKKNIRD
jgi:sugar O-acyltransferase (sialic acid O-acetyltransferase NeuD family)